MGGKGVEVGVGGSGEDDLVAGGVEERLGLGGWGGEKDLVDCGGVVGGGEEDLVSASGVERKIWCLLVGWRGRSGVC
ncbi:hypothetical protein KY290_000758 [Solanum tuberosum]|uniref:Uncharacterized protein n=1 Tax=Solanum tuberosum TaxID=4113 RepID=A0ABQ7WKU5_SOLTU|nr:hypothetical protein KY289_000822 [Solanum tuberosum]KAH0781160.1 hypothetical protein KY290_000758 [Solanum tuberosum]